MTAAARAERTARFRNPVIPGFHPDPSVCRVGNDYYLACSSFEYFPAIPIFHSTDLSRWRQIGNALDRPEQARLVAAPSSGGIFAPTLRHHDGTFWLITTNRWDRGHLIVRAQDPAGPWSNPVVLDDLPGVDPDLVWDCAGGCWLTYAVFSGDTGCTAGPSGAGTTDGPASGIMQAPIDPVTGRLLAAPRRLWSGTGLAYPEAPHLYRVGERWYLLIAEGGTERGHAVSVARGPSPQGPFEGFRGNPVLSSRSTDAPVQNTGHGDLVQAVDGSWWMVLLGVRPRGGTPAYHVLGRETFLTSVRWSDGWPIPQPVPMHAADAGQTTHRDRDDFDASALAPLWVSVRQRPGSAWSLTLRPGWLTLHGNGSMDDPLPTFVGRRQLHPRCSVRARIDPGAGCGGLSVRLDERHHYEVEAGGGRIRCVARIGPLTHEIFATSVGRAPLTLRVDIEPESATFASIGAPPDRVRLGFEDDERVTYLGELDGRYLSTEVAGGFTGRVIGMYAARGTVCFDWFDYSGA